MGTQGTRSAPIVEKDLDQGGAAGSFHDENDD